LFVVERVTSDNTRSGIGDFDTNEAGVWFDRPLPLQLKDVSRFASELDHPRFSVWCAGSNGIGHLGAEPEGVNEIANVFRQLDAKGGGGVLDFLAAERDACRAPLEVGDKNVLKDPGIAICCHNFCQPRQRKTTTSSRSCSRVAVARRVRNKSMRSTS